MKRNRLLMLMAIILALMFASFFGNVMSYAILYATLVLPFISFLYMLYVYQRFKVYQVIKASIMIKGEEVPYQYMVSNEDFIYYKSINIKFLPGYSKVEVENFQGEVALLPGEKHQRQGRLTCLYRGEYKIGIDAIIIKDLFNLFSLKVPKPSTISARVYPRIIPLHSLRALHFPVDHKNTPLGLKEKASQPDIDLRPFLKGDDKKTVHWKATAKYQELLVRPYMELPQERTCLFLDISKIEKAQGDSVILEDSLLEITLAILNYYGNKRIAAELIFYRDKPYHFPVKSLADFNILYESIALLPFDSDVALGRVMKDYIKSIGNATTIIALTAQFQDSLAQALSEVAHVNVALVLAGDREGEDLQNIKMGLGKTKLISIPLDENIAAVLEKSWD